MPVSEDVMKHLQVEHVFLFLIELGPMLHRLALSGKLVFQSVSICIFLSLLQRFLLLIPKHFTNINYSFGPMAYVDRTIKALLL